MSLAKSLVDSIEASQQPAGTYQDEQDASVQTGQWSIQNVPTLEWAMMRKANLESEVESIEKAAAEAHRRIDARAGLLKANIMRGLLFFQSHIIDYAQKAREQLLGGGKKKSRTFLYGTVGWRSRPARLVVQDKDALAAWLPSQDSKLFRVKIEPEMKALNDLARTGVIPPGCTWEPEHESLYIDAVDPANPSAIVKGE